VPEPAPSAFISYSREDSEFALRLANDLKAAGARVWFDQTDIVPGHPWDDAIKEALNDTTQLVVVLSPSSARSTKVLNEISFAHERRKIIIPLLYLDCDVPLSLQRLQRIDVRADYARGLAHLLHYFRDIQPDSAIQPKGAVTQETRPNKGLSPVDTTERIPFEAYPGTDPYIFASYSHKDSALVFSELKTLHEQGFRIWYDEGIASGSEWPEFIATALHGASVFLVYISHAAVESRNVRNEINFALNRGKPFLAVYLEDTSLPPGLELRMGDIHAIMKWKMAEDYYERKITSAFPASVRRKPHTAEELRLKEEADAGAAEELRLKEEADAGAAEELRLKQEADTRATVELRKELEAKELEAEVNRRAQAALREAQERAELPSRGAEGGAAEPAQPRETQGLPGIEVLMPQMGNNIMEGTVTKWLKSVGDTVQRDEPLFEISTDKVDAEIPSPSSGTLAQIRVTEGSTVAINTVVALIRAGSIPQASVNSHALSLGVIQTVRSSTPEPPAQCQLPQPAPQQPYARVQDNTAAAEPRKTPESKPETSLAVKIGIVSGLNVATVLLSASLFGGPPSPYSPTGVTVLSAIIGAVVRATSTRFDVRWLSLMCSPAFLIGFAFPGFFGFPTPVQPPYWPALVTVSIVLAVSLIGTKGRSSPSRPK
jgi:biotin carboxyl carrier protein